jgi:hypothetical protein
MHPQFGEGVIKQLHTYGDYAVQFDKPDYDYLHECRYFGDRSFSMPECTGYWCREEDITLIEEKLLSKFKVGDKVTVLGVKSEGMEWAGAFGTVQHIEESLRLDYPISVRFEACVEGNTTMSFKESELDFAVEDKEEFDPEVFIMEITTYWL